MRKLSPHLKQVRQCDLDLSVFKRVIKGSEGKILSSIRAGAKYLCIFQELNKSLLRSESSNAVGCAVVKTDQSVLLIQLWTDTRPVFQRKPNTMEFMWEQRVAGGSWHAFLKRLRR